MTLDVRINHRDQILVSFSQLEPVLTGSLSRSLNLPCLIYSIFGRLRYMRAIDRAAEIQRTAVESDRAFNRGDVQQ